MKKLLIMLMAVAMVAFLFGGCGVTPDPDPVDPGETSTTPVISEISSVNTELTIDLYSSDIQYMNKEYIAGGILVSGYAPKYSKVQVYIDGVVAGIGYAYGGDEIFKVFVSNTNLGVDGEKSLGATATETGLLESGCSTEYEFVLDTVAPEIVNLIGEAEGFEIDDKVTLIVTFSEAIAEKSIDIDSGHCLWDIRTADYEPGELFTPIADPFDLVLPEVLEMEAKLKVSTISEFTLIRLAYDYTAPALNIFPQILNREDLIFIADLAGNELLDSVNFCYLELVE